MKKYLRSYEFLKFKAYQLYPTSVSKMAFNLVKFYSREIEQNILLGPRFNLIFKIFIIIHPKIIAPRKIKHLSKFIEKVSGPLENILGCQI